MRRRGFTIVELLIVIVVIAILAAITIVAFNGIQDRAKSSSAQSAASQSAKKVLSYAVENADQYPATLAAVGVVDSGNTSYQYSVDNASRTFCITTTTDDISYYTSNSQSAPAVGGCPGHGVNGSAPVINYARRTTPYNGNTTPWTGYNAAGGHSSAPIANAWNGDRHSYRYTAGAPGFSANLTIGLEYQGTVIAVPADAVISPSIHVRSSKAGTYRLNLSFLNGTTGVPHGAIISNVSVPANTWVRLEADAPVTVPSPADRMSIRAQYVSGSSWVSGDWIEVTGVSTAPGAYADGSSPNWVWNGTPYDSTSTGPQL